MLLHLPFSRRLAIVAAALLLTSAAHAQTQAGKLVIVGGALENSNRDVWNAFIDAAHGDGPFVIISAASDSPQSSGDSARSALIGHGLDAERIQLAKLAVTDDQSTDDVDESQWAENGEDALTAALLASAAAVWFTGGDQARIAEVMLNEDGSPRPALIALKQAHFGGTVIGGTSAGAAIMSQTMIIAGDTMTTLVGGAGVMLETGAGLHFFKDGVIDQHFDTRARLGRLVAALMQLPDDQRRIGFGVDEDTALIASADGSLSVAGAGYVTVVDARAARRTLTDRWAVENLTIHLISPGDHMDHQTLALRPAAWKSATIGNEYVKNASAGGGGMAASGQMLPDVIGEGLVDNGQARQTSRFSFNDEGDGVLYRFTQLDQSAGFWGRGPNGVGRYTIANIRFDIEPVRMTLETAP
jgi:cyanophycinase